MTELVDLTQELYHKQPVYHTHPDTIVWTDTSHEESEEQFRELLDGDDPSFTYESQVIQFCDHGPTHVDAIRHLKPQGTTIDNMSLDTFYSTSGKAIDVSHREPGEYITLDDLQTACDEAGVDIGNGDIVLLRTGHFDEHYPEKQYNENYPGLNEEATQWLINSGIKNFGVDSPSPDTPSDPTYPCHTLCKEHEIPHMEHLRNIDKLVGKDFTFMGFPLRIREGSGSPIRAVARVEE